MPFLLENGRHRHPIDSEHGNHLCSSTAAEEAAALGARLLGAGDSSGDTKVSHLAALSPTAIAAASLVPHQLAQRAVHVAQEEALSAAG